MPNNFDPEMQEYYDTLPVYVQETINQSGVKLQTKQDLVNCAQSMMERNCGHDGGAQ